MHNTFMGETLPRVSKCIKFVAPVDDPLEPRLEPTAGQTFNLSLSLSLSLIIIVIVVMKNHPMSRDTLNIPRIGNGALSARLQKIINFFLLAEYIDRSESKRREREREREREGEMNKSFRRIHLHPFRPNVNIHERYYAAIESVIADVCLPLDGHDCWMETPLLIAQLRVLQSASG